MGIQLPSELADVAANAGVRWPKADEDAMRSSAQAWRDAGTKLTALARDADGTAGRALSSVSGRAGTAAQQHWQTFVAPDTGHLTSAARGCSNAADRLEHAADQVGAAKVRIVAHLVNLAQHTDAANQAAAAGHPTALAGLSTIVHGTANDVAQVNHSLTTSIRLDNVTHPASAAASTLTGPSGPLGAAGPLGAHGPLGAAVAVGPVGPVGQHGVLGDQGVPVPGVPGVTAGVPHGPLGDLGAPGGPDAPPQVVPASDGPVGPGAPPPPVPGLDAPRTGPITPLPDPAQHGVPTPPMGVTVTSSAAPAVAPPPPTVTGPSDVPVAPVASVAPIPHQASPDPGFTAAPTPPLGTPMPPPAALPQPQPPPQQPQPQPPQQQQPQPSAPPVDRSAPAAAPGPRSAAVTAVPQQPAHQHGVPALRRQTVRRDEVALFLVYLFPIGQLPQPSSRPFSRQLPPPAEETDFAAGLRFAPHDHPRSCLVTADGPGTVPAHPGLTDVPELAEGHDPLGGDSERDWDHRFLVRPAGDGQAAEYAWPPGELFPEGGCDVGEPVVLDPDTVLDRFGSPEGRVFGGDGTPFARRSLPPDHLASGYHRYKITKALPVWRTLSAAWFGQPGGGVRYRAVYPAADLIAMGYLTELTGTADGH